MRAPFIGPAYTLNSVNAAIQRCVNLYPEVYDVPPGKEQEVAMLIGTPGLTQRPSIVDVGSGPIRGMHSSSKGVAFVVSGTKVFYYSSITGISVVAGTLPTTLASSSGPVSMADNGLILVIVDGEHGYTVNITTSTPGDVQYIVDPDFMGADKVDFIDGYFVFNKPDTQQYYISGLYDIEFNALDFSSAEGAPDKLVSLLVSHRELWLFGETSIEIHYNSGNADFPFERIQGAFIEYGCAAPFSVVRADNTILWLAKDEHGKGIVMQASGYQPSRISTHSIEQIIQAAGGMDDAVAYVYQRDGHTFYVLNFTSADTTIVYDLTTKLWHERAYLDTNTGTLRRHRGQCHMFFAEHNLIGDYATGAVYSYESGVYSDDGNPIPRIRSTPHLSASLKEVFHAAFQLDLETGVGLDGDPSAPGADPVAMLRWSDDGGHTWSNEKWAKLGKIGKFRTRALWRRLGRARDRVYEVKITDPVKVTMLGAELNATAGR